MWRSGRAAGAAGVVVVLRCVGGGGGGGGSRVVVAAVVAVDRRGQRMEMPGMISRARIIYHEGCLRLEAEFARGSNSSQILHPAQ